MKEHFNCIILIVSFLTIIDFFKVCAVKADEADSKRAESKSEAQGQTRETPTMASSRKEMRKAKRKVQKETGGGVYNREPRTPFGLGLSKAMFEARKARCYTAICGNSKGLAVDEEDYKWAIEPLIDLPIGLTFALGDGLDKWNSDPLHNYIQNHEFSVQFVAGLRFWFIWDIFSISIYYSKPILDQDKVIHINGSDYPHSAAKVRRPFPGIALGFLADTIWVGFDINELRNGDEVGNMDPNFEPNQVLSRIFSVTLAIMPANTLRSGIGTLLSKKSQDKENSEKKPAEAEEAEEAEETSGANAEVDQSTTETRTPDTLPDPEEEEGKKAAEPAEEGTDAGTATATPGENADAESGETASSETE